MKMLDQQMINSPQSSNFSGRWSLPAFTLESGIELREVDVAYEAYGRLNKSGDNVVWVCHALTGDAHVADDGESPGWWGTLIGPGKVIDTNTHFVVCANVLGGCAGSTGPASLRPSENVTYGSTFPEVTIRDMVAVQKLLAEELEVTRIELVIGGSLGGMQALEWAATFPDFVQKAVVIAADPSFSTMGIAYNDVMRQAILMDPHFHGGDYAKFGEFPAEGLKVARMLGMISYRTAGEFQERFGRDTKDGEFQVNRYLRYQGEKLVKRFDAGAYLTLMQAMDTHDVGRGRGGLAAAFANIKAELVWVGIENDLLYPPETLRQAAELAKASGVRVRYLQIQTRYGHDAFLIELDQLQEIIMNL